MDLKMIITHLSQTKCIKYMAVPQWNSKIRAQNLFGVKGSLGKHYIKKLHFSESLQGYHGQISIHMKICLQLYLLPKSLNIMWQDMQTGRSEMFTLHHW